MTKKEQEALNREIEELESGEADLDEIAETRATEVNWMIERLCEMSNKDYKHFIRSMRYERIARKHLGEMSANA